MAKERLQKILAHGGISSRRKAEELIVGRRVRVNGRIVTELGAQADPRRDRVEVDGQRIVAEKPVYYLLNKPKGMVSTLQDPEGRPCIGELVRQRVKERVYPIGRLDFHTSGVLLITNDGDMTEALLHPRKDVAKTYVAKFGGHLKNEELELLRSGVVLDDGEKTRPCDLFVDREEEKCTWVEITLKEGRNRQIHRMAEAIGKVVLRLTRISFAGLTAEKLKPGMLRPLTEQELFKLKRDYLNPAQLADAQGLERRRPRGRAEGGRFEGTREVYDQGPAGPMRPLRGPRRESGVREPREARPTRARAEHGPVRRERDARDERPARSPGVRARSGVAERGTRQGPDRARAAEFAPMRGGPERDGFVGGRRGGRDASSARGPRRATQDQERSAMRSAAGPRVARGRDADVTFSRADRRPVRTPSASRARGGGEAFAPLRANAGRGRVEGREDGRVERSAVPRSGAGRRGAPRGGTSGPKAGERNARSGGSKGRKF